LRHLREKSWLGLFIGAVTAPAILILNLTLPVVDDEAEKALMAGEKEGTGQIRLQGEDTAIRAYPRSILSADNDASSDEEEDGVEGRGTILLDGASGDNPWDTSETQKTSARANLQVGSALRHLQQDVSPVLPTRQSGGIAAVAATDVHIDDAQSTSSEDTCHSDSSHVETRLSRTLLGIAQCAFAPAFCTWAITSSAESKHVLVKTVFALLGGTVLAIFALLVTVKLERREEGCPPGLLKTVGWTRVAVGFFVSVLYIMSIVDEVVSILQTLGLVLGLSDAILGLTVFAMGNSLGDLVANITIARMGHPVMAISACFAGPLLNLLLGIGFSGSYLLSGHSSGQGSISAADFDALRHVKPHVKDGIYHIDFSPTLTVSGCGLLFILVGTMIAVPMNNFYLDRKIGLSLICTYAVIMCINIAVEVYNLQG
jgi:sodium/potassium/calcium exchanger 6